MNRVKMNAKHEYEYVANYKVMQNVFKAKKIDKVRRDHFLDIFTRFIDFRARCYSPYPLRSS